MQIGTETGNLHAGASLLYECAHCGNSGDAGNDSTRCGNRAFHGYICLKCGMHARRRLLETAAAGAQAGQASMG